MSSGVESCMPKQEIKHPDRSASTGAYSDGVILDGWLYISAAENLRPALSRTLSGRCFRGVPRRTQFLPDRDQQRAAQHQNASHDGPQGELLVQPHRGDGEAEKRDQVIRERGLDGIQILQRFQEQNHGKEVMEE